MKTPYYSLLVVIVTIAIGFLACSQPSGTTSNSAPDRQSLKTPAAANSNAVAGDPTAPMDNFWTEAAIGGMAEVELGRLASTKAQNAEVKQFGQMMVTDHSKANDELKSIAARKNISLPTSLDPKHQSTVQRMQGLSGAEFDRAYVEEMVKDHEEDVEKFEQQSQDNSDPDAKAFAAKTLPTLRKHLDSIKSIQAKMK